MRHVYTVADVVMKFLDRYKCNANQSVLEIFSNLTLLESPSKSCRSLLIAACSIASVNCTKHASVEMPSGLRD